MGTRGLGVSGCCEATGGPSGASGGRECLGTRSEAGGASQRAGIHMRGAGSGRTGSAAEPVAVTAGPGPPWRPRSLTCTTRHFWASCSMSATWRNSYASSSASSTARPTSIGSSCGPGTAWASRPARRRPWPCRYRRGPGGWRGLALLAPGAVPAAEPSRTGRVFPAGQCSYRASGGVRSGQSGECGAGVGRHSSP